MLARLLLIGMCLLMNVATASPSLTTESELSDLGLSGLEAYWQQQAEQGIFNGFDGLALPYAKLINSQHQKAIILVNGRTETYLKYQELARDLFNNGYNVYLYDHRGQGLAPRLLQDTQIGYVADFDDYVQDLEQFVQQVVLQDHVDSLYLLSHSMGGTISALWLSQTHVRLQAAALSSPMMGIYHKPLPRWLVSGLLSLFDNGCRWLGHTACYAPGQANYENVLFKDNVLTHSEGRYQLFRDLYQQQPQVQLGGVSIHWLKQALLAGDKAIAQAGRITIPLLVLQAGNDVVVDNSAQNVFCQALAHCNGGQPKVINKASHELFIERDNLRQPALEATLSFFEQYEKNSGKP
ncbi:MAG: alpha/beta fold hydrolase [Oceanisphaera sp.]|uniref:alpha/beta fold hydrolase n=1 Tax=Oceanisphaera sp. TaxID=1929979 RepID=UPI003C7321AE